MFEDSLLESAHLIRRQSRWPAFASIALQGVVAAAIIVIPLLRPAALTLRADSMVLTAPEMPKATPPRTEPVHSRPAAELAQPTENPFEAPPRVPTGIDRGYVGPAPENNTGEGMVRSGDALNAVPMMTEPVTPRVTVVTPVKTGRVSLGVSAGLLLEPIRPVYSAIARAAGVQGTVVIHAIISKEGRIESANVMSGPVLLQGAALEAVKAAHYRPYLLNGEPTEVETTFSINFHMSS